ncbi:MAG TPA: hypothetical protein VK453_00435 [Micromonosporaceae bacterium]|nr:hypothetical protein [Micromonosporaceae bacterium]
MAAGSDPVEHAFDLNIGTVLEHWTVPFAIREILANALDEQALSDTTEPVISRDASGRWRITDAGRGLRYEHLTQNESAEKRRHPDVIGQFGMGLKDALAVFDRRGIPVRIASPHADITTARRAKQDFPDVVTLHAIVTAASNPDRVGTEVVLDQVDDADVAAAKRFFLHYSDERVLESTEYGEVLAAPPRGTPARIYVKGLLVAEEPNFLFSYNIRRLCAALRRALNRERSNVGRGAYTDRVKAILTACRSTDVAAPLTADLAAFTSGRMHDELSWRDVALHACRVLQTTTRVVFVTAAQMAANTPQVTYAQADGYRIVVVPDAIARSLAAMTDLDGNPMTDLNAYRQAWNDSFAFNFVDPAAMTAAERTVHDRTRAIAALVGTDLSQPTAPVVLISETMRLNDTGYPVLGVWEPAHARIVIRRDQLTDLPSYAGTLLHEIGHLRSNTPDGTLAFERELTDLLGIVAATALSATAPDDGHATGVVSRPR